MTQQEKDEKKKKKKKQEDWLEAMIFDLMKKSAKTAIDEAVDELLKDWK